jgi:hypothetical protein
MRHSNRAITTATSVVLTLVVALVVSGCLADNAGKIVAWSESGERVLYGDVSVAPNTRVRVELSESCSAIEYCTEDPVRIVGVTVDGPDEAVTHRDDADLRERGLVDFEAGTSGEARVTIEYENSGEVGAEVFTFRVEEPDAILLKSCEGAALLENHPRVDLIEGYTRGGERMLAGGYTGEQGAYSPGFSPPEAVALDDDDTFGNTFRIGESGEFDVVAPTGISIRLDASGPDRDRYTYSIAPLDVVQALDIEQTVFDLQDGQQLAVAVDVVTERPMCVEPAFFTRILTPDVCQLFESRAKTVDDPNAFWTLDGQFFPKELRVVSVSDGTCRLALSVPGGDAPVVYREIEAELSH